jgi:hypothetical protein
MTMRVNGVTSSILFIAAVTLCSVSVDSVAFLSGTAAGMGVGLAGVIRVETPGDVCVCVPTRAPIACDCGCCCE